MPVYEGIDNRNARAQVSSVVSGQQEKVIVGTGIADLLPKIKDVFHEILVCDTYSCWPLNFLLPSRVLCGKLRLVVRCGKAARKCAAKDNISSVYDTL